VRDIETIDAELRLLVRAWRVARVVSDRIPSTAHIEELLGERAAALERERWAESSRYTLDWSMSSGNARPL
jgi:hypothetical protein